MIAPIRSKACAAARVFSKTCCAGCPLTLKSPTEHPWRWPHNIGMGHLEDARVLTQRSGGDPHMWPDVRAQLPKLQDPAFSP